MTNSDVTVAPETQGEMGYSFAWYEQFLRDLAAEYDFGRYSDPVDSGTALVRHDVDLSPERALHMAKIERRHGVRATYFFLVSSPMYNVLNADTREVLATIREMGHDVGLHFSTHQYWEPDDVPSTDDAIAERVGDEWELLSTVVDPIETVSFHIPPDGVLRREFEAFPSTYEPRFFTDIDYCGDSNQRWRGNPPDVAALEERLQLLVHPGLWGEGDGVFDERVREGVAEMESRTQDYAESRYITQQYG